ncbi:hypothetical protein [Rufibacter sp. LB8]|uniref:hypothetical protein n=1 Tax=Rufibacter sp. LB8 TaxID=2777781 RepID=UPI00178C22CD|nr:hypothetical protein [Rufibacter sp. LB8]
MQFSISEFKERLTQEWTSGGNPIAFIREEIKRAENTITGVSPKTGQADAFVSEAIHDIDTYIFQLQELIRLHEMEQLEIGHQKMYESEQLPQTVTEQLDKFEESSKLHATPDDPLLRKESPPAESTT